MISSEENCKSIRSDTPSQTILKTNVIYIAKLINEQEVTQLMDMLTLSKWPGSIIYMKEPKRVHAKASLDRQISLYNPLPNEIKRLSNLRLKRQLKT